jgi:hypothetical protein
MKALWVRARSELRKQWRAIIALSLLAGLPGGIAIAAAAGASRTDTVTNRVVAAEDPPDIFYIPQFQETKLRLEEIARIGVVAAVYPMRGFLVTTPTLLALALLPARAAARTAPALILRTE